jgi:hypothetical protein
MLKDGFLWNKSHPLSSVIGALRSIANSLSKGVLTSESGADAVLEWLTSSFLKNELIVFGLPIFF